MRRLKLILRSLCIIISAKYAEFAVIKYIYQDKDYPHFTWDDAKITGLINRIAIKQGRILGKMQQFGFGDQQIAMLNALTEEITKSCEIEGEILNSEQVRSSLAKRLNIHLEQNVQESHYIDGLIQTMIDAVNNYNNTLTAERLFAWHTALFPTGFSGIYKINVGKYRNEEMQIVSVRSYEDRVYYEAPTPDKVSQQMAFFLDWLDDDRSVNPIIKVAIAHLWFVIIHPFDDGNGRITRIITEMLLARAEQTNLRFYSMSAQIQREKRDYYRILEITTTGDTNITMWLEWFLGCLERAIDTSEAMIENILQKSLFWQKHSAQIINPKQREIMNRLLDGFKGNMTSGKVAKFLHVSQDTATRMLTELTSIGVLQRCGSGRNTHYVLINQ